MGNGGALEAAVWCNFWNEENVPRDQLIATQSEAILATAKSPEIPH